MFISLTMNTIHTPKPLSLAIHNRNVLFCSTSLFFSVEVGGVYIDTTRNQCSRSFSEGIRARGRPRRSPVVETKAQERRCRDGWPL